VIIIAIIVLAIILLALISTPRRPAVADARLLPRRTRDDSDGLIYGETPDGTWHGGTLPEDFHNGGGENGGGGGD
jgi:uncharacterized membrane protein YgcG